jgi:hypothetical protein
MKEVIAAVVLSAGILFNGCSKSGTSESPGSIKATQTGKDLDTLITKYLSDNKDYL